MRQVTTTVTVKQPRRPLLGRLYCVLSGRHEFERDAFFCRICKYPRTARLRRQNGQ